MWLTILSDQLPIVALVSRYLTNKLIGRGLISERQPKPPFIRPTEVNRIVFGISSLFRLLSPSQRQITHALLTRSPLSIEPKFDFSFGLHALSTPPAFVLSRYHTLHKSIGVHLQKIEAHSQVSKYISEKSKCTHKLLIGTSRSLFNFQRTNSPFLSKGNVNYTL